MTDDEILEMLFAVSKKDQENAQWTVLEAAPWQVEVLEKVQRERDNPVRKRQVEAFRHEYNQRR